MKEMVMMSLNNAVENAKMVTIDMEVNDMNGIHTSFVPDAAEEIDGDIIIYKGTDVYNISPSDITSPEDGVYVLSAEHCKTIITF